MMKFLQYIMCATLSGCTVAPLYQHQEERNSNITVDVIANREGQQLRRCLQEQFRDLPLAKKYRLTVTLNVEEKPFAEMSDENAQRVELKYIAHVTLRDDSGIVMKRDFFATTSNNISTGHGDVIFSLYGRNNINLIQELSTRIVEGIRVIDEK